MEEYEAKLKTEQWLGGQQPSAADREAIEKMTAAPNVATFPNTFAWYCLVSKFTPAVRGTWSGAAPAKGGAKPAAAAKKDDDFDPFADENEEDKAASAAAKAKADEAKDKKKKEKPAIIAKSIVMWEVKPYSSDINLDDLFKRILTITLDGLVWKQDCKKEPVAFGVFKIIVCAVVEDLKVSTDQVEELMLALELLEKPTKKEPV